MSPEQRTATSTAPQTATGTDAQTTPSTDAHAPAASGGSAPRPPAPQVWPTLRARDARALIRFLVDAFGFRETVVYDGDGDLVQHAELAWPEGGGVMLGSLRPGAKQDAWRFQPGSFGAYVVTADPDAVYARAKAAGADIAAEPHVTDYGSRDFAARDPEGNLWNFGTYPGEPQ